MSDIRFRLADKVCPEGRFYDSEVRMINKFSELGGHRNIVPILRQGWIEENRTYFLDMECCLMTLDTFIRAELSSAIGLDNFLSLTITFQSISHIFSLWGIMRDITAGLRFIHSINTIHRDLKPKNGIFQVTQGS